MLGGRRRKSRKTRKSRGAGMKFCRPDMSAPGPDGKCKNGSDPVDDGSPDLQHLSAGRRRKSRKTRKSRKMKAGGYGYGGEVISPGNIVYGSSNTSVPTNPDGSINTQFAAADTATNAHVGGGRRRKSKKAKKGGKRRKSRKMRGGVSLENISTAGTSFTGAVPGMAGSQTYGGYTGYSVGSPANNPHSTGADGVTRV